jgi:hypothetical protein
MNESGRCVLPPMSGTVEQEQRQIDCKNRNFEKPRLKLFAVARSPPASDIHVVAGRAV